MPHNIRTNLGRQIDRFRKLFLQSQDLPFDDFFSADSIGAIVAHTPATRSTVFTPLVTLKAFIGQVLAADGSCRQAVAGVLADRLGTEEPANTANTGPYCKARQRLPLEQLEDSARTAGLELHQEAPAEWQWKGHKVVLADGTTVTMPDTPESQAVFPQPESQKPGLGFPMARMVALISLAAGTVIAYALGPYQGKDTGETSLLSQLLDYLSAGDLLMADRYYCTFAIIALMQARNIPVLFQMHARKKADFSRGIRLGAKDHWVTWKKPKRKPVWMSVEEYAALPDTITVRELAVAGMVYVTTLFDPKTYRKQELASLYQDRWIIELDIRAIKTHMGMDMLRCKSPDMVKKEIAVHILAYNIIRGNLMQAAHLYGKIPRRLSFKSAVQLMREVPAKIAALAGESLIKALLSLLKAIASTPIGIQKRGSQPRAIKRRPKPYPLLTVPRKEAVLAL